MNVNQATGKELDVASCSTADGADLRQWSWLNNTCQRFRLVTTAGGKVAEVANRGTTDGSDVRQWSWLNNNCQQWQIVPV